MNVTTIRIPEAEAKEKLRAYRKQLHRRADDEFAACAAGYEQLAKGRALLNVADAIRSAPRDEKNRPRLAIARADRHQVHYLESSGRDRFCAASSTWNVKSPSLDMVFSGAVWSTRPAEGYALVPMVPADALEAAGNPALKKCFVLWEVEQWADRRIGSRPDIDPLLLLPLGGDLYAVLAEWNLTPLERAVMAVRASR